MNTFRKMTLTFLSLTLFLGGCATEVVTTQGAIAEQRKQEVENAKKQQKEMEKKIEEMQKTLEDKKTEIEEQN